MRYGVHGANIRGRIEPVRDIFIVNFPFQPFVLKVKFVSFQLEMRASLPFSWNKIW